MRMLLLVTRQKKTTEEMDGLIAFLHPPVPSISLLFSAVCEREKIALAIRPGGSKKQEILPGRYFLFHQEQADQLTLAQLRKRKRKITLGLMFSWSTVPAIFPSLTSDQILGSEGKWVTCHAYCNSKERGKPRDK